MELLPVSSDDKFPGLGIPLRLRLGGAIAEPISAECAFGSLPHAQGAYGVPTRWDMIQI